MNWQELWIGDEVWILSKQKVAYFEKDIGPELVNIRIGNTILPWPKKDLSIDIPDQSLDLEESMEVDEVRTAQPFKPEIDLHIEKLTPHASTLLPFRIREIQMAECEKFLQEAISRQSKQILIIHGKGEGILKDEVHTLLKSTPEVFTYYEKNNGGATEVLLRF